MNAIAKQLLNENLPVRHGDEDWREGDLSNTIIGMALNKLSNESPYQHGSAEDRAFKEGVDAMARAIRPALESIPAQNLAQAYNKAGGKDVFNTDIPEGDI